jgi:hypothetical protein
MSQTLSQTGGKWLAEFGISNSGMAAILRAWWFQAIEAISREERIS